MEDGEIKLNNNCEQQNDISDHNVNLIR